MPCGNLLILRGTDQRERPTGATALRRSAPLAPRDTADTIVVPVWEQLKPI